MHIHFSAQTTATSQSVMQAATAWLQQEAPDAIVLHEQIGGADRVTLEQLQDGVRIVTSFTASPTDPGTAVAFELRMRGTSLGSRIRNAGMVPMTRIVRRAAAAQFAQFIDDLAAS